MSRRGSTAAHVNLAKPYAISHENISGGKHIEGSKRKLRWRFGWSDSELEHEVDFNHTITSGKKKIIEDGREITSSSSLFSSDFSHGWNSNGHMFRVEANTSLTSDPVYIFSIDGVKFEQFMSRDEAMRMPKQEEVQKRPSVTTKLPPAQRAGSITANKPVATNAAQKVVAKTESNSFDPFAPAPETASVDPFAPTPAAPVDAFSTGDSDPFAPTPAAAPTSQVDPFAPPQSTSAAFATSSFDSSGPSDDPFFSGASTAKKPFAPPAGSQATFASQASNSAPARRQSAIEIMGDFAGMTAEAPPPPKQSVMLPEPPKVAAETSQGAPAKAAPTDPWASLVDLDLNKKGPGEQHAQRRASINAGPALSSQLKGDDKSNNRRGSMPSMPSGNINPFGQSSGPQNGGMPQNGGDPFAAAQQQPYQQQQPFGKPQYGQGMGSGPVNPFGSGGPAPNPGMNQGYGGGMNSGYGGNTMGMGGGYGAPASGYGSGASGYQQQQQPQKRSSLDSLDPFKM